VSSLKEAKQLAEIPVSLEGDAQPGSDRKVLGFSFVSRAFTYSAFGFFQDGSGLNP
jgi:hypothetical protein